MTDLKITCFEHLKIELNGRELNRFETDKARALLVYLAVEISRPQRRSHLAGLLWSDQPEEQALHSLRQTLSSLRKTFEDASSTIPLILADRDTVQLNQQGSIWVDVQAFRAALSDAYRHSRIRDQGGHVNLRQLAHALELARGPFLGDFEVKGSLLFSEWQALIREELDQMAVTGLTVLAETWERRADYGQAIQAVKQIVARSPWDEAAHATLMRLHALNGQPGMALNQYRLLRRSLKEQLDLEPSRSTIELFERIRATGATPASLRRFDPDPSNLPVATGPFVGREQELDQICACLADPACRLLTLLGPGGVGKTRLALEAARQQVGVFRDGVFFISLATISSPDQVYSEVADALRLVLTDQSDPQARVIDYLRRKQLLLVLDNYEQILAGPEGTRPLVEILRSAVSLTLLVTSRERLLLQEEWIFPVSGMGYPPDRTDGKAGWTDTYDALTLFLYRARQVQPNFTLDELALPAVIRICRLLEGLPLGVELAAATVWKQPCGTIAENISVRLDTLAAQASNHNPRHRSLWAAFDISWQLLSPSAQDLFMELAVFAGGFTHEAAYQILGAESEQLADLVNKSLLNLEGGGRYRMHEAVRQYATDKLACSGRQEQIRRAHAHHYARILANQQAGLQGQDQKQFLTTVQAEIGNCRQAWYWMIENQDIAGMVAGLDNLYEFFNVRSRFSEGIDLFEQGARALETMPGDAREGSQETERALGMLLARSGSLAHYARQNDLAQANLERAQEIFIRLNDPAELAFCRTPLGGVYLRAKEFEQARSCAFSNLEFYRRTGGALGEIRALYLHGLIENRAGKILESKQILLEAVKIGQKIGEFRRLMAPYNLLGDIACSEGKYQEAENLFQQSLSIARELEDRYYQAIVLNNLASVYLFNHQYPAARKTFEDSLQLCRAIGDRDGEAVALNNLGEMAVTQGQFIQAIPISEEALKIAREIGEDWTVVVCLNNLGEACCGLGQAERAMEYLVEALRTAWQIEALESITRILINVGRCRQLQKRLAEAADCYRAVLAHPSAEHDTCAKATRWLAEMGDQAGQEVDERILEKLVEHLVQQPS